MAPTLQIWTGSWFAQLPDDIVRVGISRGVPRRMKGFRRYRRLEPGPWFNSVPEDVYIERYLGEVLAKLDPEAVLQDLAALSAGRSAALLCWEQPGQNWCHRGLVAWWLWHHTGLQIREFDHDGVGMDHPMLPQSFALTTERRDKF